MVTLLEQVKQIKTKRMVRIPEEEMVDLALAWLHGEISTSQIQRVLFLNTKTNRSSVSYKLFSTLKWAVLSDIIEIRKIEK